MGLLDSKTTLSLNCDHSEIYPLFWKKLPGSAEAVCSKISTMIGEKYFQSSNKKYWKVGVSSVVTILYLMHKCQLVLKNDVVSGASWLDTDGGSPTPFGIDLGALNEIRSAGYVDIDMTVDDRPVMRLNKAGMIHLASATERGEEKKKEKAGAKACCGSKGNRHKARCPESRSKRPSAVKVIEKEAEEVVDVGNSTPISPAPAEEAAKLLSGMAVSVTKNVDGSVTVALNFR